MQIPNLALQKGINQRTLAVCATYRWDHKVGLVMLQKENYMEGEPERGSMTVKEAGSKGGINLFLTHGREHFQVLAGLAHQSQRDKLGDEGYVKRLQRIAKEGGEATKASYGREHFAKLGREGGKKLKEARGREYYQEIGRKGALSPKRKSDR